ncbi:hypothetical protein AMBLS11_12385 [Alteromonas macleodii str. 'Black Sea 11']|nr:hypothetical protein AMBLS11_12385 [Alteromonas macleodii str. 'Black Sea 11']
MNEATLIMTALIAVLEKQDLAYTVERSGEYRKVSVTKGDQVGNLYYQEESLAALGPKELMQPIGDELAAILRAEGAKVSNPTEAEAKH